MQVNTKQNKSCGERNSLNQKNYALAPKSKNSLNEQQRGTVDFGLALISEK